MNKLNRPWSARHETNEQHCNYDQFTNGLDIQQWYNSQAVCGIKYK